MKVQKMFITKTVGKCLKLILQFKSNQELANSLLIKKTANDFHTTYTMLMELLTDQSMPEYMKLSVIASSENMGQGVLEQKIMGQTAQMNYYSLMVENVKKTQQDSFQGYLFCIRRVTKIKTTSVKQTVM